MKISQANKEYNKNSLTFGNNIKILTNWSNFEKLPLRELNALDKNVYKWDIKQGKFLDEGYTLGMSICTAVKIENDVNGFLCHLQPKNKINTKRAIAKKFKEVIKTLKQGNKDLTAFLTGDCINDKKSIEQYIFLKNLLTDYKVSYSSVWGFKSVQRGKGIPPQTDLFTSIPQHEHIINSNLNTWTEDYTEGPNRLNITPRIVENLNDLKEVYEEVIINPKDTLTF